MKSKVNKFKKELLDRELKLKQAYNKLSYCTYAPSIYTETEAEIIRLKSRISQLKKFIRRRENKAKQMNTKNSSIARTLSVFGSEPKKHRRVNMGSCGCSAYDGCKSNSIHVIYTPVGGK